MIISKLLFITLIFLSISGVVNIVLNVILIAGFDMGVEGVALATTIAQGVSALLVIVTAFNIYNLIWKTKLMR